MRNAVCHGGEMKATGKQFLDMNVYEAAVSRLHWVFDHFERVCVAFSGGKDSTVLLHLAIQIARERKRTPVHAFLLDLEGQYRTTVNHVIEMFSIPDVLARSLSFGYSKRDAKMFLQTDSKWKPSIKTIDCG
jgi:predicted phosphoadenosine phosphosulfate sulfurtransferase